MCQILNTSWHTRRSGFDSGALAAALMGAAEGMVRDRVLAKRAGDKTFSEKQVQRIFGAMLNGFAPH